MTTRVRSILSRLDASAKKRFVKIMPAMAIPPECLVSVLYPHALLSQLPKESCYLLLGVITESMLRFTVPNITMDRLIRETNQVQPLSAESIKKIRTSKTTEPYLQHLRITRAKFDVIVGQRDVQYDSSVF